MNGYQELNGRVYKFYDTGKTFWEAQLACKYDGASFVNVITAADVSFVQQVAGANKRIWISK